MTGAPEVVEPSTEVPGGWEFLHSLPKKKCKEEERQLIIILFDHVSKAHAHVSSAAACVSLLGKITDPHTFDAVVKAMAHPMVQINVLERYLSPVQDLRPTTTMEAQQEKISKMLLLRLDAACLAGEPKNSPTWLLVAVVWLRLKRKYMNSSVAKDACMMFNISAKHLSKILSGKNCAGGGEREKEGRIGKPWPKRMQEKEEVFEITYYTKIQMTAVQATAVTKRDNGTRQRVKD